MSAAAVRVDVLAVMKRHALQDRNKWMTGRSYAHTAARKRDADESEAALTAFVALIEAAQGVLDDDAATTSLADQRARWGSRMDALRAALARVTGGQP